MYHSYVSFNITQSIIHIVSYHKSYDILKIILSYISGYGSHILWQHKKEIDINVITKDIEFFTSNKFVTHDEIYRQICDLQDRILLHAELRDYLESKSEFYFKK
jgi:hypothetical protein